MNPRNPRLVRRAEVLGLLKHSCLLTVGVWVFIFGAAMLTMTIALRPPGKAVTVPNVVGMDVEEAKKTLADVDLQVEVVGERHDESVPKGAVCLSVPGAGKKVREGRQVHLFISKGPTNAIVPELTGLTLEKARERLAQAGLSVGQIHQKSSKYVEGTVVSQSPRDKTKVAPGTQVDLEVSAGPDFGTLTLPDGTKMLCRTVVVQVPEGQGYVQVLIEKKADDLVETLHDQLHRAGETVQVDFLAEPGSHVRVYLDQRKVFEQSL
ncbi:MAG: PASTA domain-containing protein [Armatimonadota bacterium]